jgi:hypothetical protein
VLIWKAFLNYFLVPPNHEAKLVIVPAEEARHELSGPPPAAAPVNCTDGIALPHVAWAYAVYFATRDAGDG